MMTTDKAVFSRIRVGAFCLLALIAVQVVVGATVRATGSGMGCPDWPLCHGQWLPAWNFESVLEYAHRLVGAVVSVSLILLTAAVFLSTRLRSAFAGLAGLGLLLLIILVSFGAMTVAYDMPPAVVATHLELAALVALVWLTLALRAGEVLGVRRQIPPPGLYRWAAILAFLACFFQLFLGAMVSVSHAGLACPDFPTCFGMWIPPLVGNVGVQVVHRLGALVVAVCVFALVALFEIQGAEWARGWVRLAGLLLVAQIGLGAANVFYEVPPLLSVLHLLTGVSLFFTLYIVVYACWPSLWLVKTTLEEGESASLPLPLEKPRRPLKERLAAYYQLTKPTIVMLVVLTGLPAIMIASNGRVDVRLALAALFGTACAAASAAVFNQFFERERDKQMSRTATRPIPAGLVTPREALVFAILLGACAAFTLMTYTNWLATALAFGSLLFYGFFYTLVLKGSSPQNIVIGGAAGASAPLIGWAAVTGEVGWPAWVMFAIVFFWTPPHFWALAIYRLDDYVAARVPMFPVVYGIPATVRWIAIYALMLVPLTLFLVPLGAAGPIYFFSALFLGLGFLVMAWRVLLTEDRRDAIKLFAYSIVYTLALFTMLTLDAALGGPRIGALVAWGF
ncbi:MAG: heme o synthase [Candidatus Sericytochromatia bacterium]|nr:heme o synthase [Candidatus Sericytochromatia bacterium]